MRLYNPCLFMGRAPCLHRRVIQLGGFFGISLQLFPGISRAFFLHFPSNLIILIDND